jgi:hypothetical protein
MHNQNYWAIFAVLLLVPSMAMAGNGNFLPQTAEDLTLVPSKSLPAPAPQVRVDIPSAYVPPAVAKSADILRLATGQSKTITLDQDAASVIVANPAHATVFLDSARNLIVIPRAVGATNFKVLNRNGEVILNQSLMVNDTDDSSYVRVTRICGGTNNCLPISTYYCPDNCVPVAVPEMDAKASYPTIPPIAALPPLPVSGGMSETGVVPPPPTPQEGVN